MTNRKDKINALNIVIEMLVEETIRTPRGDCGFTTQDLLMCKMRLLNEENS